MDSRYIIGSEEDFHDFISLISKKDKIGIITHTDVDGVNSLVILSEILNSKGLKPAFVEFLDYDTEKLKKIYNRDYNKLFFTDWNLDRFPKELDLLRQKGGVFIIDHHPLNEELKGKSGILKTESKYCTSHFLYDIAKKYYNLKNLESLACSAIIGDYTFTDDDVFNSLKKMYPNITRENIWESEPGKLGDTISNAIIHHAPKFNKIYNFILKEDFASLEKSNEVINEEINQWKTNFIDKAEYFPKEKLYFYYAKPKYRITSKVVSALSNKNYPDYTLVFVSDNQDRKGYVKLSSRNQTDDINLSQVLGKIIEGFENANAGGHPQASGGSFPKKYLKEFKKRLIKELGEK